jgi:nicotinamidase-related amidase
MDGRYIEGSDSTRAHPAVAPAPGEVTVTKRRVSAFAGSDLDVVLRLPHSGNLSGVPTDLLICRL